MKVIDTELELKNWPHPADAVKIIDANGYQDQTIEAYTDGSKNEHGVGSGVAVFVGKELAVQLKLKLDNICSNNKAEQLSVFNAREVIETIEITANSPRTASIFTDSRISADSLKNVNNHSYLIEEPRKMSTLERANWTIEFS
jgi:ribonuclease HI